MKTIGLIGGMSWESSLEYYRLVNVFTKAAIGGFSSSKCLMYSVDFAEIEHLQHQNNWDELDALMANAAAKLYKGGAEIVVLCTNTMHLCSDAIKKAVPIPFLHIAEATGKAIQAKEMKKVGLLGTKFTMEKDFYKATLKNQFGIETIIPNEGERSQVHQVIYEELVLGKIEAESRKMTQQVIKNLVANGAEGIVLGCTEIPLLIKAHDVDIPIFDTTTIHAKQAVDWALGVV